MFLLFAKQFCRPASHLWSRSIDEVLTVIDLKLMRTISDENSSQNAQDVSLAVLFVNKYLEKGCAFTIDSDAGNEQGKVHREPKSDLSDLTAGHILHTWCQQLDKTPKHITMLAGSICHVFSPDLNPTKMPGELAVAVFTGSACCQKVVDATSTTRQQQEEAAKSVEKRGPFRTLTQELWSTWQAESQPLKNAIKQAAEETKSTSITNEPVMTEMGAFPTGSTEYITQGDDAYSFVNHFKHLPIFKTSEVAKLGKDRTSAHFHGAFGCFAPGTKISLPGGVENIENLTSGAIVYTNVNGTSQASTISEVRTQPGKNLTLYGFNEVRPFFYRRPYFRDKYWAQSNQPNCCQKAEPLGAGIEA